ncbi:hypothetical protein BN11_4740003 [Nostocoides australiense Ben110]|uniref:Uncharacterized protein n=1 Tax=Nostocoides australiense Ben110 TaxID=1193182 RepID=W6K132_9MICO|nr:hypothetical protein [Tetrasphaera australiensis]CCH74730.1 hypothetical protein BN11_4740003 [Tetrasphaera australiensis Ben110]
MNGTDGLTSSARGDVASPDPGGNKRRTVMISMAAAAVVLTALIVWTAVALLRGEGETTRAASPEDAHAGVVTGTVWVANEAGNSLTAIDAATNEVVTTVEGIEGPHNVQVVLRLSS